MDIGEIDWDGRHYIRLWSRSHQPIYVRRGYIEVHPTWLQVQNRQVRKLFLLKRSYWSKVVHGVPSYQSLKTGPLHSAIVALLILPTSSLPIESYQIMWEKCTIWRTIRITNGTGWKGRHRRSHTPSWCMTQRLVTMLDVSTSTA
jgi:hypothetical protein